MTLAKEQEEAFIYNSCASSHSSREWRIVCKWITVLLFDKTMYSKALEGHGDSALVVCVSRSNQMKMSMNMMEKDSER